MSRAMRVWRRGKRRANVPFRYSRLRLVEVVLRCPGCGQELREVFCGKETLVLCRCGVSLLLTVSATPEELEVWEVKGG